MNNLLFQMPTILEEDGGTEQVLFKKTVINQSIIEWKLYFDEMILVQGTPVYISNEGMDPLFIFIHGAGHAAMSFALLINEVKTFATCVTYDIIGHGESQRNEEICISNLLEEAQQVLQYCLDRFPTKTIILVGHSLGGAIVCKINHGERVKGLVLLDILEKKAIQSFANMECMLRQRPQKFQNLQSAINYHIYSHTINNPKSAQISVPHYLNENCGWKIDLLKTTIFWRDWYEGMQERFDNFKEAKMVIVADHDRINQDAYQILKCSIHVFENSGHSIHEDEPKKLAKYLNDFVYRQRIPINLKEIEDFKKQGIFLFRPKIKEYAIAI